MFVPRKYPIPRRVIKSFKGRWSSKSQNVLMKAWAKPKINRGSRVFAGGGRSETNKSSMEGLGYFYGTTMQKGNVYVAFAVHVDQTNETSLPKIKKMSLTVIFLAISYTWPSAELIITFHWKVLTKMISHFPAIFSVTWPCHWSQLPA